MNKQEAKQKLHNIAFAKMNTRPDDLKLADVMQVIDQIHEPQKVVVSKIAVEYYYKYKDCGYSLGELLSDFYSESAREEFPRLDELATWLHDNDEDTNRQRELALATLIVNGPDAVEIEQEQLYTVEIPDPNADGYSIILGRIEGKVQIKQVFSTTWKMNCSNQLTESEIKQDFEWAWNAGFAEEVE